MSGKPKQVLKDQFFSGDNLAAVRKMAAKKGAQIQFQMDVATEEEWTKLLEKQGLIVVDVYSDWCGPCTAMVSSLKKLKLEIGCDSLNFAIAKSSAVEQLKRFRNKSEPTWLLIAEGNLVNVMFGVDAPSLIQLVKEELARELEVLEGKAERKSLPFDELSDVEKQREALVQKKIQEKQMEYQRKLAAKMNVIRERSLLKLAKMLPTHSCIIYFPHMVAADGSCIVAQKMMYLNDSISATVIDQIHVQMNETTVNQVFYKCPVFENFNDVMKESLLQKPVLVTLLQTIANDDVLEISSPRPPRMDGDFQTIEQKLNKIVYGCENPIGYSETSVAYEFIVYNENGDKMVPMWTPTNQLSKAAAIEVLFPRKIEAICYVPEELPPPQIIIIYDANKVLDVMEIIKEHQEDVFRIGFFDSVDPQNAKLICKTFEQFSNLSEGQTKNSKMVLALKKGETEDLLLEFSQIIPLYISANEKVGTEESEQFFPFDYDDDDEEIIPSTDRGTISDEDRENINIDNVSV